MDDAGTPRDPTAALGPMAEQMARAVEAIPMADAGHGHGRHGGHGDDEPSVSIREVEHAGKRIVVRTTYEITIDGEPLDAHIEVDDAGRVHGHGFPNYAFPSVIDLVKRMIDSARPLEGPDEIAHVYEGDH